jgi:23S rRNA (uracil1939-C5)-methyltransferase
MPRRRPFVEPPASEVEVLVEAVGALGDGLARHAGTPVYVPAAAPGDRVRVRLAGRRGDGLVGEPRELLAPGEARAEPPCPHFGACGGCLLQHLTDGAYRDWKRGLLRAALDRRGLGDVAIVPTVEVPRRSRRRASLAARRGRKAVFLGFNEHRSHRIVDMHVCEVLRPEIVGLLPDLRAALADVLEDSESAEVAVASLDDGLDVLLRVDRPAGLAARERLAALAEDRGLARLSWRRADGPAEPLAHRRAGHVRFGGVAVTLPPGAFLQATAEGEAALAGIAAAALGEALPRGGRAIDLFAGSGALTFPLAGAFSVHAVEAQPDAVAAIRAAAAAAGPAGRATAEARDLYRDPVPARELARYDAVVFDPPRSGGRAQTPEIAASGVPLVVAVSCNPASFAADARCLVDAGYALDRVTPVDQFLWAAHLELAGIFHKRKK